MSSGLVNSQTFLTKLELCFSTTAETSSSKDTKGSGSVWLTHKRYTHTPLQTNTESNEEEEMNSGESSSGANGQDYDVLIRCTNGDDISFSCRIPANSLPSFHAHYGSLLKSSLSPFMRKRDKKKEKARQEVVFAREKKVWEDVEGVGKRWKRVRGAEEAGRVADGEAKGKGKSGEPGVEGEKMDVDMDEGKSKGTESHPQSKKIGHRQRKRRLVAQRRKEAERERLDEREARRKVEAGEMAV